MAGKKGWQRRIIQIATAQAGSGTPYIVALDNDGNVWRLENIFASKVWRKLPNFPEKIEEENE